MSDITLVVTSCGRHDLLERTLRSFNKFNTYHIKETIIAEDGNSPAPVWLEDLPNLGPKTWIAHGKRKGQIYSADRAWAEVKTDYVFWAEDDWEFFRAGFIEQSLEILENYPNILQCSIRDDWDHPSVTIPAFPFPINEPDWREGWSGFAFNPGLRRLAEYRRIGSYGRHVGYYPQFVGELELSKLYRSMGYYAAALPAACKHIGGGNRHVPWETAPKAPKVLIAIPACHAYDYEKHADVGIHRNNASTDRIEGVRATWQKYVGAFEKYVEMKFVFGQLPTGCPARCPKEDEVFLDIPDAYDSLPLKVQAIYKWALERNFDYAFKADDDTFIYLDRLLASGFEDYDYLGYCTSDKNQRLEARYASGGSGYWVSAKAMRLLAKAKVDEWAEDLWVGKVLFQHGIKAIRDQRYLPGFERHWVDLSMLPQRNPYISFHACSAKMMQELYDRNPSPVFEIPTHAMNEARHLQTHPGLTLVPKERVEHFAGIRRLENGLRVLIAITSCHKRGALRDVQRQTWVKDVFRHGADYRFFLGKWEGPQPTDIRRRRQEYGPSDMPRPQFDEICLDVADDYAGLPAKTRALLQWAYDEGYSAVFKLDDDSYCNVARLLASGFEKHDYSGCPRQRDHHGDIVYAQGGAGYWLSRAAIERVVAHPPTDDLAEDVMVARIMAANRIPLVADHRYSPDLLHHPTPVDDMITAHNCKPDDMQAVHRLFEESRSLAIA